MYQVSKLTTGLVIAHIIVSILVIAFYARVAALKKQKLVQKYKNIVLWAVSGLVCALILLDMAKTPDLSAIGGNEPGTTLVVNEASAVVLTLFIATIVHLVVSIVLAIPFFYDMIISILPTKSYKNQILWCVSLVVCLIMGVAVAKLLKESQPPTPTLTVEIKYSGELKSGTVLTAEPTLVNGPESPEYEFQWVNSKAPLTRVGNAVTYTLTANDQDASVHVLVNLKGNTSVEAKATVQVPAAAKGN